MSNHWKSLRFHYTSRGHPKVKYRSYEDALLVAKKINQKKTFGVDDLVEPYECKMCGLWHIGRSSKAKRDSTLWYEIGDRAYHNLVAENTRPKDFRLFRIKGRFRFMGWPYNQNTFR